MAVETPHAQFKQQAALRAVAEEVRDGMVVGLGSGSTAAFVLQEIARRMRDEGFRIRGIPTSEETAAQARGLGIPLVTLEVIPDVVLDGADQVDPALNLIKGGGGAHTREKIVALSARRVAIVADYTKAVPQLRGPIPLEVLSFSFRGSSGNSRAGSRGAPPGSASATVAPSCLTAGTCLWTLCADPSLTPLEWPRRSTRSPGSWTTVCSSASRTSRT